MKTCASIFLILVVVVAHLEACASTGGGGKHNDPTSSSTEAPIQPCLEGSVELGKKSAEIAGSLDVTAVYTPISDGVDQATMEVKCRFDDVNTPTVTISFDGEHPKTAEVEDDVVLTCDAMENKWNFQETGATDIKVVTCIETE